MAQCAGATAYSSFHPGQTWLDTDGQPIRAHSAGLLTVGNDFYWYGADNYTSGDGTNVWINVYHSTDLMNWQNKGHAYVHPGPFPCDENPAPKPCGEADRPKVVRNPDSGLYLMVTKSSPRVSLATATSPLGPFTFKTSILPNGHWVGDLAVFQDPGPDGRALYLVYSVRPNGPDQHKRDIIISKFTLNWDDVLPAAVGEIKQAREGPAVFFVPGTGYFIWTSHVTGWNPNAASVFFAASIESKTWTEIGNPTNNSTSFRSQSTYILPVNGSYIYIADRFEPYVNKHIQPRYVWLPINVTQPCHSRGSCVPRLDVPWRDTWSLADQ